MRKEKNYHCSKIAIGWLSTLFSRVASKLAQPAELLIIDNLRRSPQKIVTADICSYLGLQVSLLSPFPLSARLYLLLILRFVIA